MDIKAIIRSATEIVDQLPFDLLRENDIIVDRTYDNPEAARYFLMFADWDKVFPDDIFSNLDKTTGQRTQIYVDLPFCGKFCNFCAFYGVVPRSKEEISVYTETLKKEISLLKKLYFSQGFKADALELGGGTPTFLPLDILKDVVGHLSRELPFVKDHEFNFEASPETITGKEGIEKLEYLKESGADRMSIGVQSFNAEILKNTNRPHDLDDVIEAINNAKRIGFNRINVDLIVGLEGQTIEDFIESVNKTIDFGIDIIELYTMRYFDTKEFVPMKKRLDQKGRFLNSRELLIARVAADRLLKKAKYSSANGRTYESVASKYPFYAAYYEGNFKGMNTLGIGRKCNSNVYPWQYANYRNIEKYCNAINKGRLAIACGTRFTDQARVAKLLTGSFQLPGIIDFDSLRANLPEEYRSLFDPLIKKLLSLGLIEKDGVGLRKTFTGFLFIEEILKQIYDLVVTPFSNSSLFLGRKQAVR
ncbi:MAG: radical SAM protein [Candidatus Omnitrophica bacterium]|nr:radical SAM protein [Candidatus Omnitrophota bacterium]MBU1869947.1 radical SAM protein [Candidatus Omnitrophota bacterium]